jgi:hypothetical protein
MYESQTVNFIFSVTFYSVALEVVVKFYIVVFILHVFIGSAFWGKGIGQEIFGKCALTRHK